MINTIKDIFYAVTSPEKYRDFMNYKMRRLLLYVFVLVFASGIVNFAVPAVRFLSEGGLGTLLETNIPEFTASSEDGFWIEEPVEIDEYDFLIKADSDSVREDISDLDGQYGSYEYVIMVDQEQIYLKAPGMGELTARFDEMPGFSFSKADIIGYIPLMYVALLWFIVLSMLMDYGYYFLVAAVISWMGGIFASFMRVRLGGKKLFRMSVYAGTLTFLLSLIQMAIGQSIPNFSMFGYVITLGYLFFAIKDYKESGIEELPPDRFGGREDKFS